MKATLISMLTVALLGAGICIGSVLLIGHVSGEMEEMRNEVLEKIEAGDGGGAHEMLRRMAEMWKRHEGTLAYIASHEDLHEIAELIIESNANLEAEDLDDFRRSMELLGMAIGHLHEEERLRLSNIL